MNWAVFQELRPNHRWAPNRNQWRVCCPEKTFVDTGLSTHTSYPAGDHLWAPAQHVPNPRNEAWYLSQHHSYDLCLGYASQNTLKAVWGQLYCFIPRIRCLLNRTEWEMFSGSGPGHRMVVVVYTFSTFSRSMKLSWSDKNQILSLAETLCCRFLVVTGSWCPATFLKGLSKNSVGSATKLGPNPNHNTFAFICIRVCLSLRKCGPSQNHSTLDWEVQPRSANSYSAGRGISGSVFCVPHLYMHKSLVLLQNNMLLDYYSDAECNRTSHTTFLLSRACSLSFSNT